ncbi:MAG: efflux RND transporter periplasmic adaptor subunit [Verrucomicrobiaceae bacterium]
MNSASQFLKLAFVGLTVCLEVTGCRQEVVTPPPPPPQVQVIEVKVQDVPIAMEWIGTLQGSVNASIRAQVEGTLLKMNYEEGLPVKKGDVLFELDDRTYLAALANSKGSLGQMEANLVKTQKDVERLGPLLQSKAVSQQDYDNAVQANLAAKASVDSAKAAVDRAELNVGFTKILSPLDGIAGLAKAQVGDLVTPGGNELTTVATVDPIKAYFTVSEQEYLKFREDNPDAGKGRSGAKDREFEIILANGNLYPQKGTFYAADVSVNPGTGALRLCAIFPNNTDLLRPGQYARVRAVMKIAKDAIVVPQRAVSELQGIRQIAVVTADNKASIRTVKAGPQIGSGWLIEEGIKPGDKVIVEGFLKVREGLPVVAIPFKSPTAEATAVESKPAAK